MPQPTSPSILRHMKSEPREPCSSRRPTDCGCTCAATATARRRLPIVCLPGLTRNGGDFDALAAARSTQVRAASSPSICAAAAAPTTIADPANYSLPVELADVIAVLTALEIGPAIFLGTSRGGILTMLLAARGRPRSPARSSTTSAR